MDNKGIKYYRNLKNSSMLYNKQYNNHSTVLTENKLKLPLDGLLKLFSIFYILLIVAGSISISIYYLMFDININDFFTLDDYINVCFASLPPLLLVIILILIYNLFLFFFFNKNIEGQIKTELFNLYKIKNSMKGWKILSTLLFIAGVAWTIGYIKDPKFKNLKTIELLWLNFIIYFTYYAIYGLEYHKIIKHRSYFKLIILCFEFMIFVTVIYKINAGYRLLENQVNKQNITFYFVDNTSIATTDNVLFLGSSKDYIFLYSKEENKSKIISKSTIISIVKKNTSKIIKKL